MRSILALLVFAMAPPLKALTPPEIPVVEAAATPAPSPEPSPQATASSQPEPDPLLAAKAQSLRSSGFVRVEPGFAIVQNRDLKNFEGAGPGGQLSGPDFGPAYSIGLMGGYGFASGWSVESGLALGSYRSSLASSGGVSESLDLEEYSWQLGGSYQVPLSRDLVFGARLNLGPAYLSGHYSASIATTYSSGPFLNSGTYALGSWSVAGSLGLYAECFRSKSLALGAELGYRLADFSAVNGYNGNGLHPAQNPLMYSDGALVDFNDSGIYFKLNLLWLFKPSLRAEP